MFLPCIQFVWNIGHRMEVIEINWGSILYWKRRMDHELCSYSFSAKRSATGPSLGRNLQPFTGNVDVSIWGILDEFQDRLPKNQLLSVWHKTCHVILSIGVCRRRELNALPSTHRQRMINMPTLLDVVNSFKRLKG